MISLTKYTVKTEDYQSPEDLLEHLTHELSIMVEHNLDMSTTLIQTVGSNEVEVKILRLNEHSN